MLFIERNHGDCRNLALSELLKGVNIDISPVMCFGLGEGLDFKYWVEKDLKIPMIVILGRDLDIENNLIRNLELNIKTIGDIKMSEEDNMKELDEILGKHKEVFINVDRYYLKYLREKLNPYHCGYHSILVRKIITEKVKKYIVYDGLVEDIQAVDEIDIKLGRSSKHKPFSPNFYGFYIQDVIPYREITFDDIKNAIVRNLNKYLYTKNTGINAFKNFITEFINLNESFRDNELKRYLKLQMNFISRYILEFESTKSFYRKLYASFLNEVNVKYKLKKLDYSIKEFNLLGNDWNNIGMKIAYGNLDNINEFFMEIKSALETLCKNEHNSVESLLYNIVNIN